MSNERLIVCPFCDRHRTATAAEMDAHLLIEHPRQMEPLLASNEPLGPGAEALPKAPIGPGWPGEDVAW